MSKKKPGSKYAMKQGRERYLAERARHKAKLARRRALDNENSAETAQEIESPLEAP
jgi:hypothetical protein